MWIFAILLLCASCAAAAENAALVRCAGAAALRVLPKDPEQVTVGDARDIAERVNACRAQPDGGAH
jgi:hypothetical protein